MVNIESWLWISIQFWVLTDKPKITEQDQDISLYMKIKVMYLCDNELLWLKNGLELKVKA